MASDPGGTQDDEDGDDRLSRFDTGVPHPARVYDAWLGGKDNFAADRAAAEAGIRAFPSTVKSVRANRAFLARAVEYLAAEAGIRQFLDIGTGLPSASNTHEVAQAIAPDARIVYVDNDHRLSGCVHAVATMCDRPFVRVRDVCVPYACRREPRGRGRTEGQTGHSV